MIMQGSGRWREGADTCVYKPAVHCTDVDPTLPQFNPGGKIPDGYVSRIVQKTSPDVKTEDFIKQYFKPLVDKNYISVYARSCTPLYLSTDAIDDSTYVPRDNAGCSHAPRSDPRSQLNLIAPKLSETFAEGHRNTFDAIVLFKELRHAFYTAASLVSSDTGPWIIHTDLHYDNLLKFESKGDPLGDIGYALHDWGRTLIIKNPTDFNSVINDLKLYKSALVLNLFGLTPEHPKYKFAMSNEFKLSVNSGYRSQTDPIFLKAIDDSLIAKNMPELAHHLRKLRIWSVYSLMTLGLHYANETNYAMNEDGTRRYYTEYDKKESAIDPITRVQVFNTINVRDDIKFLIETYPINRCPQITKDL